MDRKYKRWELALMFGVLFTLIAGTWLGGEQEELAGSVIRLHVIANSDSPADQQLKLAVRDQVLKQAEQLYPDGATLEEARAVLTKNLPLLEEAGQQVVTDWGRDYPVSARLEKCWFPTKEYVGFALPAGNYEALRIVIGEGEGQNWWCVAFPPLCLGAASQPVENTVQAGNFTDAQVSLITQENEGYVLKFKSLELLGRLQGFFQGEQNV